MHKALKWTGIGLGSVVALVFVCGASVYVYGGHLDTRTLAAPAGARAWTPVASTPALVTRGQHVSLAIAKCMECHGPDLGGAKFIDDPALGSLSAPNITSGKGGRLSAYDDAALERLLRHGIKADGHPALVMPSEVFANLSDEDLASVIAYLRTLAPVDREPGGKNLKLLARALLTFGVMKHGYDQIDHAKAHVATVAPSVTPEYGKYLVEVAGCTACHGPGLSGGKIPGAPPEFKPASNLTPKGIGHYKEEDFFRALREGMRPGNVPIDTIMPWRYTKYMTDDEIKAVYAYLKTVPGKDYGGR